jgi:hypothetical protein
MDINHQTSDRQSLLLTQAAVRALEQSPSLVEGVLRTLDHWDQIAPKASQPLRNEWREIVTNRHWHRALDPGDRGQQLRQASPLGKALDPALRLTIIRQCKSRTLST